MHKRYTFRIYPTKNQRKVLNKTLELCRFVYNKTLETRKNAWEQEHKSLSLYDTQKMLTAWKKENPELKQVYTQVLRSPQLRVDLAYKAFFRRIKLGDTPGYPRFKGEGRYDSFTYSQFGFAIQDNRLILSKIGKVKIIQHREIQGDTKTLTIKRDSIGNWYAVFACEVDPIPLPISEMAIGIDMGLMSFATFSNGEKIENPRFFRKSEKELTKANRKLSVTQKGNKEHEKRRKIVRQIYSHITNKRRDFAHKLSRMVVDKYGTIALEKLNVYGMVKNHCFAKSISDASWNQFVQYIVYKAEYAGRKCVLVDPRNTSKRCSRCGTLVEKDLSVRVHSCPTCGLTIDRDENAAINILALGLQCLDVSPRSSPIRGRE